MHQRASADQHQNPKTWPCTAAEPQQHSLAGSLINHPQMVPGTADPWGWNCSHPARSAQLEPPDEGQAAKHLRQQDHSTITAPFAAPLFEAPEQDVEQIWKQGRRAARQAVMETAHLAVRDSPLSHMFMLSPGVPVIPRYLRPPPTPRAADLRPAVGSRRGSGSRRPSTRGMASRVDSGGVLVSAAGAMAVGEGGGGGGGEGVPGGRVMSVMPSAAGSQTPRGATGPLVSCSTSARPPPPWDQLQHVGDQQLKGAPVMVTAEGADRTGGSVSPGWPTQGASLRNNSMEDAGNTAAGALAGGLQHHSGATGPGMKSRPGSDVPHLALSRLGSMHSAGSGACPGSSRPGTAGSAYRPASPGSVTRPASAMNTSRLATAAGGASTYC
jgi:hypothetical protein